VAPPSSLTAIYRFITSWRVPVHVSATRGPAAARDGIALTSSGFANRMDERASTAGASAAGAFAAFAGAGAGLEQAAEMTAITAEIHARCLIRTSLGQRVVRNGVHQPQSA